MYAIIGFASICKPIERSIPLILCFNFTDSCISANKIIENITEKYLTRLMLQNWNHSYFLMENAIRMSY